MRQDIRERFRWQAQQARRSPPPIYVSADPDGGSGMGLAPKKVLLVEDDLDTVHTLTFVLRQMGHTVEYAINGYVALDLARKLRPDVIVMDIGLPGMDGFELCKRIKADSLLKDTRVIALTAYGQEEYRKRSLAAGCEAHLVKPHDARLLAGYLKGSA